MDSSAYDAWHQSVHGSAPASTLHLAQWHYDALSLAVNPQGRRALEIGCGSGDFAVHLSRTGAEMTAVDFSPAAIEMARARATAHGEAVNFQAADAQTLPFSSGSFDSVFSCECLEHLPDPARALREMARVLRSGGQLVLTTENYSNAMLLAWFMAWWRKEPFNSGTEVQPIEQFFLFWRVRRMIEAAGLRVRRMIGTHHVFLLLPGMHPHTFVRERFRSPVLSWFFRPWARHVSFLAEKP
jgi:ubiquinone/menaquinone biosynthesis C-methylase UbiE